MSGCIFIITCNILLYAGVRFFKDNEFFKNHGNHRLLEVITVGIFCFAFYMFAVLNGAIMNASDHIPGKLKIDSVSLAIGILTGLPWCIAYAKLVLDTAGGLADTIYGLDSNLLDKVNLKVAHEFLIKGERREAIGELTYLTTKYPDAYSHYFLLAILAEEDKDFDKAVDMYRAIISKHSDNPVPWTNAAQNLAELLRREYNDISAAKHLEAEILERNPDTKYKYSTTKKKIKKNQNRKKRNIQVEKADINHARRLIARGNIAEAIALMKRYIAENPDDSRSHFELITILERQERHDETIIWLQKTIRAFDDNDQVWGDAMMRLAGVREHGEKDTEAAVSALELIAQRLKHAKHGRDARDRLKEIRSRAEG